MAVGGLLLGVIAVVLPPLAVLIRAGCGLNFVINIALLFLGWIPAILHAWFVILDKPNARQRHAEKHAVHEYERKRSRSADSRYSGRSSYDRVHRPQYYDESPPVSRAYRAPPPYPDYRY